jgi:hypothetical protein
LMQDIAYRVSTVEGGNANKQILLSHSREFSGGSWIKTYDIFWFHLC